LFRSILTFSLKPIVRFGLIGIILIFESRYEAKF
jgi:hypothetical protein